MTNITEIWVAGCPSFVGGADTELYHQIMLWRKHEIAVHIVPNQGCGPTPPIREEMVNIGCEFHRYSPELFKDKIVVNYCNGPALTNLLRDEPKVKAYIFFNCMTWVFDDEITAINRGLITHLGFISKYQEGYLLKAYSERLNKPIEFGNNFPNKLNYYPYFDISKYAIFPTHDDYIGLGRISRPDPYKFSDDCWAIFNKILTPIHKKVFILGYDYHVEKRIGKPPDGLDFMWWTSGAIPANDFYKLIDILVHKTGGSRESYCRTLIEAMAHGVVPLVENDYAFPEILGQDARMQWLMCNTSDEMSHKASCLAFDKDKLLEFKSLCREYVEKYIIDERRSLAGWTI